MKNRKKRRGFKIRHVFYLVALIYALSIFMNQEEMIKELDEKKSIQDAKIEQLKIEVVEGEQKLKYVHSPEYIEKMAREELGMAKPNEKIFIDKNKNKFVKGIKD